MANIQRQTEPERNPRVVGFLVGVIIAVALVAIVTVYWVPALLGPVALLVAILDLTIAVVGLRR